MPAMADVLAPLRDAIRTELDELADDVAKLLELVELGPRSRSISDEDELGAVSDRLSGWVRRIRAGELPECLGCERVATLLDHLDDPVCDQCDDVPRSKKEWEVLRRRLEAAGIGHLFLGEAQAFTVLDDPLPRALEAIGYTLDRADREPEQLGYHLSWATEAWAKLVDAEAALIGRDPRVHRRIRRGGLTAARLSEWEAYERRQAGASDDPRPVESLTLHCDDGQTAGVEIIERHGVYVVHEDLIEPHRWAVTHGPSAMRAATGTREQAAELARRLHEAAGDLLDPHDPGDAEALARAGAVRTEWIEEHAQR